MVNLDTDESQGERLRDELLDWIRINKIVSIRLDSTHHNIRINSIRLPPEIKPLLTRYGSIYVEDKTK